MKKVAAVIVALSGIGALYASEFDSLAQARQKREIPHHQQCYVTSAVPAACAECIQRHNDNRRNDNQQLSKDPSLYQSGKLPRCP